MSMSVWVSDITHRTWVCGVEASRPPAVAGRRCPSKGRETRRDWGFFAAHQRRLKLVLPFACPAKTSVAPRSQANSHTSWPQIRQGYPLNLRILISGGKETNKDSPSNGEWSGKGSNLKSPMLASACCSCEKHFLGGSALPKLLGTARHRGWQPCLWQWRPLTMCFWRVGLFGNAAHKMGGKLHLKLNTGVRAIANKYRDGKMKRTLKRELKSTWNRRKGNEWTQQCAVWDSAAQAGAARGLRIWMDRGLGLVSPRRRTSLGRASTSVGTGPERCREGRFAPSGADCYSPALAALLRIFD